MGLGTTTFATKASTKQGGFTLVQLLVTIAVISIVSTIAAMGISSARASIRLSNSARQFATRVERARGDAVRRHSTAVVQMLDNSTYAITMDYGASGTASTMNFSLESGVTFITDLKTITFDWRGRIPTEESIGFSNESGTANVDITGSGDITIDAEIFHDASIPPVTLTGTGAPTIPDPGPTPDSPFPPASPTPTPGPSASPTPVISPLPTPTPGGNQGVNCRPAPTPTPTP